MSKYKNSAKFSNFYITNYVINIYIYIYIYSRKREKYNREVKIVIFLSLGSDDPTYNPS